MMNKYGLKYGINMTLEELLNKEVLISIKGKMLRLGDYYSEDYLRDLIEPDEGEYSDEEILNSIIDDMYETVYDFIDTNDISIKWKS